MCYRKRFLSTETGVTTRTSTRFTFTLDARLPRGSSWLSPPSPPRTMLLDVFKDGELVETIELSASKRVYSVGRQVGLADIVLVHGSISREQATLTISASGTVVVADLGSAHGTLISGKKLAPNKPHLLPPGRSLTFGQSTRVFKLREGGSGFVASSAAPTLPAASALSAALLLDDPRVQAALTVLREGAADVERLRPDGYLPLTSLLACTAVSRSGCTEGEFLAKLPAKLETHIEATLDETHGLLLRALDGHAPACRVDTSLCLQSIPSDTPIADGAPTVAFPGAPTPLPEHLVFCTSFRHWNAVRSHGVGAGVEPACPIRLCERVPPPGTKVASLANRAPDLLVYVRTASLLHEGLSLFRVFPPEGADGAVGDQGAAGVDALESIICVGDAPTGLIGPWHFERVVSARDGAEMMGGDEIDALRQARTAKAATVAKAATARAEADEARRKQREATRRQREEAEDDDEPPAPAPPAKFNPYLAHMAEPAEEEDDE